MTQMNVDFEVNIFSFLNLKIVFYIDFETEIIRKSCPYLNSLKF
jgi:hypothetical protein